MVDFKELRAAAPEYKDLTDEKFIETIQQRYAPTWSVEEVADKVGFKLPTKPNSLLAATPNFFESGIRTYQQGLQPVKELLGIQSPEETAKNLAWLERRKKEIAPAEGGATAEGQKAIQSAQGWGDTTKAILSNPQAVLRSLGESVATFLPDLALAPLAGGGAGVLAKTIATRLAAKTLAPEAVAAAANVGKAVLIGGGSAKTEYASELLEILKDKGIDIESSSALQSAFSDPKVMADVKKTALLKAIPVGVFDAFSMGLAGRIIDPALGAARAARSAGEKLPLGSLAGRGAGELGLQAGLGGAGEALGQLSAHGEIKDKAGVLLEAFGELGGAPFEAYSNFKTVQKGREQSNALAEQEKAVVEQERLAQEAQQQARLQASKQAERAISEKSSDLALEQDEGFGNRQPTERQQTYANIRAQEEDQSQLRMPWQRTRAEQQLISDIAEELKLSPESRQELEKASYPELVKVAQGLLQQNPELAKIPNLSKIAADVESEQKLLPPPERVQTPYGQGTVAQVEKLNTSSLNPKTLESDKGPADPGNAGPRLSISNEVENILKSDLPEAKKRELLFALSQNADIQQTQRAGNDQFLATPRGEVITQPQMREEASDARIQERAGTAEVQFNQIKGSINPENSKAAAQILTDLEAQGSLEQLKVPQLQQLVMAKTGKPLPLKPASDMLRLFRSASPPQKWGTKPPGVDQVKWDKVLDLARNRAKGQEMGVPLLRQQGFTPLEAQESIKALSKANIVSPSGGRAEGEVSFSNVLSPTNALNFLKNEYNGKNYGCM